MWVYVRDYGAQFKIKTDLRMIMYEEFKKYDIRIPWPIRTVYQGDEKRESEEISQKDKERNRVIRITSYNVCYTKLLRRQLELKSFI